jgi:hypothetical protein
VPGREGEDKRMSEEFRCCSGLPLYAKEPSPFDRAIALGYYDGPTQGLVRCGHCNRVFRFVTVDSVHEDESIRIYSLAPLSNDSWERLVIALLPYMEPIWPMWVPLWAFPSETDRIAVEQIVDELIAQAAGPEIVIATPHLLNEIQRL